jgi:hypothetical protein
MPQSYVVHLIDTEDPHPLKHFQARDRAIAFAETQAQTGTARRADVYEVQVAEKPGKP